MLITMKKITTRGKVVRSQQSTEEQEDEQPFKLPLWKRTFDILFAGLALLCLSPLFLLITALIRLESKGPIFYAAKRVGMNYQVFDFYKFRSMYVGADKMVDKLQKDNQYIKDAGGKTHQEDLPTDDDEPFLIGEEGPITESTYLQEKRKKQEASFFKMSNDPRITKVGHFIRNTSIDELPQLFNILKGDMSIVGNRPLPMYEAEALTTDRWAERFMAPAGLTGLWQVEKRAQATDMSPEERKQLDVEYARKFSLWMDIKIILRTVPALLQKENV
jgi:lipopolysaccharide/colanic/teichoic acid biosynthesis glycosyltransferase